MATKLTKPVTREVTVKDKNGHEGSVLVSITTEGVELRGKGTKRKLFLSYEGIAPVAAQPPNMGAKFSANPMGWLIESQIDKTVSE